MRLGCGWLLPWKSRRINSMPATPRIPPTSFPSPTKFRNGFAPENTDLALAKLVVMTACPRWQAMICTVANPFEYGDRKKADPSLLLGMTTRGDQPKPRPETIVRGDGRAEARPYIFVGAPGLAWRRRV